MAGGHGSPISVNVDVQEHGAPRDGAPQAMDRRLFMQLLAFETAPGTSTAKVIFGISDALTKQRISSALYSHVTQPLGFGLLTFGEDLALFVSKVMPALEETAGSQVRLRPELTMFGRTY